MWERLARRVLLGMSAVLAGFLGYLLLMNGDRVPIHRAAFPGTIERADANISEFNFTQSKGDGIEWQIRAKQARLFEQQKKALLTDVSVTVYGTNGKELTVEGEEGTFDTSTKHFILANKETPLVVETQRGFTIYTNHLAWISSRKEFSTEDDVRIVGDGVEVTGRGLLGKLDAQEFEVLKDVRVSLLPAS